MMTINYIVHSTTTDNEKGIVSGRFDCPLSQRGLKQARLLKDQLKNLNTGVIFSSPLSRAKETAGILFPSSSLIEDERLVEIDYGNFTHFPKDEIDKRHNYINHAFSGGESYLDVENRVCSFLKDCVGYEVITIVSHQAPQLALDVICKRFNWEKALKSDWRLTQNSWRPKWIYILKSDGFEDLDDKGKTAMNSLSFITLNNPEWDKKIEAGLRKECEALTGIRDDFKTNALYALDGDTFAGGIHIELHGDILWIDSVWVEQNFRKQGVGRQLLQKALHFAAESKVKEIQLNTFFSEAHQFFLMCGFEDVAMIPRWKYGLTCYLMRKKA